MKQTVLLCALFFAQTLLGQSEIDQVKLTLQNYIDGSSYNRKEQLKNAFTIDATLYLTTKNGFKRYSPNEYADFFKDKKEGEFNGRQGQVLAVDIINDIATAKVKIAGPDRKWVYIDLFLLKKKGEKWSIISKTVTRVDENK